MPSATNHDVVPTQRIPAWRRLGLKLKSAPDTPDVVEFPKDIESPKRKRLDTTEYSATSKKVKQSSQLSSGSGAQAPNTPQQLVRKKSVTFTPETKNEDGDSIRQLFTTWLADQKAQDSSFEFSSSAPVFQIPEPVQVKEQVDPTLDEKERRLKRIKKPKPEKGSKLKDTPKSKPKLKIEKSTAPLRPFLQYLRQYCESRHTWKFNKNHQNHLLKHAFDLEVIPSDHTHLLYEYVSGLQGGVRTRLRDAALAIKVKDQEDGQIGFPEDMAEKEKRQQDYDRAMNNYVTTMTVANVSKNMGYEEGVLLQLPDSAMAKRSAKRMRSEQILKELGEDGTSITGGITAEGLNGCDESQKRLRMNDGSTQKLARKRKQRTVADDDTSSSDSSSDSESDSSSDDATVTVQGDDDTSSSSSSSSSSDSESSEEDSSEESDESDSD